ncbi:MAG: hypothetical protein ACJ79S_05335 [Gemmatimonadaceae bacterium]
MRRLIFATRSGAARAAAGAAGAAALSALPTAAVAQWVPGRDLFDLPLGTLAEAPALASLAGVGLWNPAAIELPGGARGRLGVAALRTAAEQGISAQLVGGAVAVRGGITAGLSVARASVADLVRTGNDPQSLGDISYSTTLLSAMLARRSPSHVVTGLALRYRSGVLEGTNRGAVGIDGGVLVDGLLGRDGRVALSSFLWSPGNRDDERATYTGAADLRVAGPGAGRELRGGYSYLVTEHGPREHFGFVSGRYGALLGRVGAARSTTFGQSRWRLRLGVGVYYARYAVGVAREETGAGLPATYQFSLSSTIK